MEEQILDQRAVFRKTRNFNYGNLIEGKPILKRNKFILWGKVLIDGILICDAEDIGN